MLLQQQLTINILTANSYFFQKKKMEPITIRKYKSEDHKEVNLIFGRGISDIEHIKNGIIIGWKSPCVIMYWIVLFLIGCYFSISYGFFSLLIGIALQATSVFLCYHVYVW